DYQLELNQRESALRESLAKLGLDALPEKDFDISKVPTVQRARVQAQNAQARLERAQSLFTREPPLISPQDFADIETQHQVAERDADVALLDANATLAAARSRAAELSTARESLEKTSIKAPNLEGSKWSVASRNINIGEVVESGTITHRLIAIDTMKLRAAIPERFVERVKVGQRVTLRSTGESDIIGKVSRISPSIDMNTRTFEVEAAFDNKDRKLNAGAFARADVEIGVRANKVQIPRAALYRFAGVERIFVVEQGKVRAVSVTVIQENDSSVVIENEIPSTAQLASSSLNRLAEGVPVRVIESGNPR
ncbi:MAG TPA: efflux RND transporter periplasmic adaptor subunit, partial [Tepidisphaeraceae bacterium]|nr:efflux RND transporter periplasmic adaptor subunit [Tepidisphaeraceae bacterium]